MKEAALRKFSGGLILASSITVTFALSTWATDIFNTAKLVALLTFGSAAIFTILPSIRSDWLKNYRSVSVILGLFVMDSILVFFLSGANLTQQFFGIWTRNTGLLTYLGLCGLLFAAVISASQIFVERFVKIAFLVGFLSLFLGFTQYYGIAPGILRSENRIIGSFGNQDFQSAFLGIISAAGFSFLLSKKLTKRNRLYALLIISLSIFQINLSGSNQGYYAFLSGVAIILLVYLLNSRFKKFVPVYTFTVVVGFFIILFGTLNKGPIASIVYKPSISDRGYCWNAALGMTKSHPFFGIGFDNVFDWYRRYRSTSAVSIKGIDVTCDVAHNVFLDLSAYGGIPLLLIYLSLLVLTFISAWKVVRRTQGFNGPFTALIGAWTAFQVQSVISINQIGLAIWGWILSGLIIGYEINTRIKPLNIDKKKVGSPIVLLALAGSLAGFFISLPALINQTIFLGALNSNDANRVRDASIRWPYIEYQMFFAAEKLRYNKFDQDSVLVIRKTLKEFPDFYEGWKVLSRLSTATPEEVAKAKIEMKRLDPLNPELK